MLTYLPQGRAHVRSEDDPIITIRTSSTGWLGKLAEAYRTKTRVHLVDDAKIGVDPLGQTLLDMGLKAQMSFREWMTVLVGMGLGTFGALIVFAALADPEPYTKIILTITGATMFTSGGFAAIRSFTGDKPPTVKATKDGFEIAFA